ncbi:MAG: hypothetical protein U0441_11920 [Polyangiaceae bacterium]
MRRLVAFAFSVAVTAVFAGCGADAREEAPAVATGEAVVPAPPNAIGADVSRPVAAVPVTTGKVGHAPGPHGGNGTEPIPQQVVPEPNAPDPAPEAPAPGEKPPKGTDL